jgi:hypothetical protein
MNLHFLKYYLLLCLAPFPLLYFIFHHCSTLSHIEELEKKIERIYVRKEEAEQVQKKQHSVLVSLSQSDPSYIDKYLETLVFLESEIKKLETLLSDTYADETIQKRLHFLKEGGNRLFFAEEKMRTKDKIREVIEKQQHPIEIHEEDLKKLLSLIEGVTIWPYGPKEGRPQLLIQDIHLTKKQHSGHDPVFVLTTQLIKRENSQVAAL